MEKQKRKSSQGGGSLKTNLSPGHFGRVFRVLHFRHRCHTSSRFMLEASEFKLISHVGKNLVFLWSCFPSSSVNEDAVPVHALCLKRPSCQVVQATKLISHVGKNLFFYGLVFPVALRFSQ